MISTARSREGAALSRSLQLAYKLVRHSVTLRRVIIYGHHFCVCSRSEIREEEQEGEGEGEQVLSQSEEGKPSRAKLAPLVSLQFHFQGEKNSFEMKELKVRASLRPLTVPRQTGEGSKELSNRHLGSKSRSEATSAAHVKIHRKKDVVGLQRGTTGRCSTAGRRRGRC